MVGDTIYSTPKTPLPPFAFNAAVADVFDDMIHRSVPMYGEIIRRRAQLIERCGSGTRIYDLGCSTGNLVMAVCERMPAGSFEMEAVDSSQPMLDILEKRLNAKGRFDQITQRREDIRHVDMERPGVVVINFTLQFIPPEDRDVLVPETVARHHDRFRRCGFSVIDVWLKWFNFYSWICTK